MITDGVGLAAGWVPVLLAVYGVGAVGGIVVGGRGADRDPLRTIRRGLAGLVAVSVVLAWSEARARRRADRTVVDRASS